MKKVIESKFLANEKSPTEGEALIMFQRNGDDSISAQWLGEPNAPVAATYDALDLIADGDNHEDALRSLPWPLEIVGLHPKYEDCFELRRIQGVNE